MHTEQLNLPPYTDRFRSIEAAFMDFHSRNPQVYTELVRLAREAKARGYKRMSAKMLVELLRWEWRKSTQGDDFKINNSYTALYARMIMEREFGFKEFFETRERKAV